MTEEGGEENCHPLITSLLNEGAVIKIDHSTLNVNFLALILDLLLILYLHMQIRLSWATF